MSQRHACALVRLSRKAASYQPAPRTDAPLVARLKALGEQYPRYGYLMLHALMKSEGLVVNRVSARVKLTPPAKVKLPP